MDGLDDFIASGGTSGRRKSDTPTPADFPIVTADVQAQRDALADKVAGQPMAPYRSAVVQAIRGGNKEGYPADAAVGNADPLESFITSGGSSIKLPAQQATPAAAPKQMSIADASGAPALAETAGSLLTGVGSSIVGGYQGLSKLMQGRGMDEAADAVREYQETHTLQPETDGGKKAAAVMASPYNPLNYIPQAADWAGGKTTDAATALGASPQTAAALGTAVNVGINAAPAAVSPVLKGAGRIAAASDIADYTSRVGSGESAAPVVAATPTPAATVAAAPQAQQGQPVPAAAPATPEFVPPPTSSSGQLPAAQQAERAAVLQRIGAPNDVRASAINGDMSQASTDYQLSKVNDNPSAELIRARLAQERAALENHAESIVQNTGGTLGMDETSLDARGRTIAQPFDQLRDWFDAKKQELYSAADQRAAGQPITNLDNVGGLLKDPDFTETLLAKDQGSLLQSVQRQFQRFQDVAGQQGGFTVANAENFRKWLNQVWTPDNSASIGKIKGALDNDVLSGAGEDIYSQARGLASLEKSTLDNPKGVSSLLNADPKTPLNRVTPFVKIPDAITRMDPDQFANVIKTLNDMPPEIQPAAQSAISEIKAHIANQALEAGNSTATQWNAKGVAKVLKNNSQKIATAFDPEEQGALKDLNDAGNILHIDASYPGAYAQQANLMKRGVMASLPTAGGVVGGTIGGTAGAVLGAPGIGAGAGVAAGRAVGARLSAGMASREALKQTQKGTVKLSDLLANPPLSNGR